MITARRLYPSDRFSLIVGAVAVGLGVGVALAPLPVALATLSGIATCGILLLGRHLPRLFLSALVALLVGYAFLGRGLAHVGVPPLYLGELVLGLSLPAVADSVLTSRLTWHHAVLVLFVLWGLARTLPYIGAYGIDALRDGVTWGYAAFAIAVSVTFRPSWTDRGLGVYQRLIPIFLIWVPLAVALSVAVGDRIPAGPGSDIPLLSLKGGDLGVHLAGVGSFLLLGLARRTGSSPGRVPEVVIWALWIAGAGLIGVITRGGLFAAAMAFLAVLFAPSTMRLARPLLVGALALVILVLVNPEIDIGIERRLSVGQVVDNLVSVVSDQGTTEAAGQLQGTKSYRLDWWGTIVDYTIHGEYFWTGKGFGVNLADADGFQVTADHSLRSPHNGHIEILARMGVPGLILWIALQAGLGIQMFRRAVAAATDDERRIFAWLWVYWAAMLVNASFDPYLQGPQGGIWFWTIVGTAIALLGQRAPAPNQRSLT